MATQHYIGPHVITFVNLYGLPRGPTRPNAFQQMQSLMQFLTTTFVYGHSGHVVIAGDFNFSPTELPEFLMWRRQGWTTAQELAEHRWGVPWRPTCKHSTERDILWLSPSVQSLCTGVNVEQTFADHCSVWITLALSEKSAVHQTWPRPAPIPWEKVDIPSWKQACESHSFEVPEDSTDFMKLFAKQYENSLEGFIDAPCSKLHPSQCGRAKRLSPEVRLAEPQRVRASRPGEVTLRQDLVGVAVLNWFRQLRRLQAFLHSIRKGLQHENAISHRQELWLSIVHAKGFEDGFCAWWTRQPFFEDIGHLPLAPPDLGQAEWIYAAFHTAFRQFESWHIQKKDQLIKARYERDMSQVFRDLREPKPDQIDCLWTTNRYVVAAVRPGNKSLLLDRPVAPLPGGVWTFQGCPVEVSDTIEELIILRHWPDIEPGHELRHQSHTKSDSEVHEQLRDYWRPRWQQEQQVDDSTWRRVTGFVQNFVPACPFHLEDVTPDDWLRTVKRLKPTAATGADGFARLDLLHMPLFYVQLLLGLLMEIEKGEREWPQQFLEAIVLTLAKRDDASSAGEYRPIVLFSMIYRCWGSLRCRQLLRQLEEYVHDDAHGFLPGRETRHSWVQIQSSVELALQAGTPLAGIATDLTKAFNCIQRPQLLHLAERLGIPSRILTPWTSFLARFQRRFQVHHHLSEPLLSSVGCAEGDPLSVLGMAMLDMSLHIYQQQLAPQVRTLSFVDNLSLLSVDLDRLVRGFFALQAFLTMWGLVIDTAKSYAWATTPLLRRQLEPLGIQMVADVMELGGSLTLGASLRVRQFLARGAKLEQKWARLRVSKAPLLQKTLCLPAVFWASALHGCLGCVFVETHIHQLRKKAVNGLGVRCGGANPLLRLSLTSHATADPGFYQLKTCFFEMRRLCRKLPALLQQWQLYMRQCTGKRISGPFFKMLELCGQVGWSILVPPFFTDHDGFEFNLLQICNAELDLLLLDGWAQYLSHNVRHRTTMEDLYGLDLELALLDRSSMVPADLGRVLALQSGAFISTWQHAKFDVTKSAICSHCLVPDTQMHWFRCPKYVELRAAQPALLPIIRDAPACVLHHLLMPRSPFARDLKAYFLNIEDRVKTFLSQPSEGVQHLFSDGSCFTYPAKCCNTAAWALLNATTGQLIGHGLVPGLIQTIARGELLAVLAAAHWCVAFFDASVPLVRFTKHCQWSSGPFGRQMASYP